MAVCVQCQDPLVLIVNDFDDEGDANAGSSSALASREQVLPDDVTLSCKCHFHW